VLAALLAEGTSETSEIAKPAILAAPDIDVAVVISVAATTAVERLLKATVAIS